MEVRKRLLLHRWRGWIWNTGMYNLKTYTYMHMYTHTPFLPLLHLLLLVVEIHGWGFTKYQRHKKKVLTRQKFLIPFRGCKKEKQSSRADFHSNINSCAGEFPMSAAIKACQIKCDTGGRREIYSNHLSNLFPELPLWEMLLSPPTARTINFCLTDYSSNHCWPRELVHKHANRQEADVHTCHVPADTRCRWRWGSTSNVS